MALLAQTGNEFSSSDVISIVIAVFGGGGLLFKLIELWRSRVRFKFHEGPNLYDDGSVIVNIELRGRSKASITYVDVVCVYSRVYRMVHRLTSHPSLKGGVSVVEEPIYSGSLMLEGGGTTDWKPASLLEKAALPRPWRPWSAWLEQPPPRLKIRLKAKYSGGKPPSYRRLQRKSGRPVP